MSLPNPASPRQPTDKQSVVKQHQKVDEWGDPIPASSDNLSLAAKALPWHGDCEEFIVVECSAVAGESLRHAGASMLSYVTGPRDAPLWKKTFRQLVDEQAATYGYHTALIVPWQGVRLSFKDLAHRSILVSKALLGLGLKHGDAVGILAGNRVEYLEVFLGASRIGCPLVLLHNTYTAQELCSALARSSCKLLFIASNIGPKPLASHIEAVCGGSIELPELGNVVFLSKDSTAQSNFRATHQYQSLVSQSAGTVDGDRLLRQAESIVSPDHILSLQSTSGTTGVPKIAMLRQGQIIDNSRFVGDAMRLTSKDILCCPPPLFHAFGIFMGFLGGFTHGTTLVYPSDHFDPNAVVDALYHEKCTALYGVPTMHVAALAANKVKRHKIDTVRTGLAAGSPVPVALMRQLRAQFGTKDMLIAYGMTEVCAVSFITSIDDSEDKRTSTVGRPMPHTTAKVIDEQGQTVARGVPGELCVSGYCLQKGYLNNEEKTAEAMRFDENGVRWIYTGDKCIIDKDGYCSVIGRIKDMIIRGGENIYPTEVEERLLQHEAIAEAAVVGFRDAKYGEVVGAFLRAGPGFAKLEDRIVREWVQQTLGSHKTPVYTFWLGDPGVGDEYPKTGSGKLQKHALRTLGDQLVAGTAKAKL